MDVDPRLFGASGGPTGGASGRGGPGGSDDITATDALLTLKRAVGQSIDLLCPPCGQAAERVRTQSATGLSACRALGHRFRCWGPQGRPAPALEAPRYGTNLRDVNAE